MTFPVVETAPEEHQTPDGQQQKQPILDTSQQLALRASCPACDGSGLWRGIDGFVFACMHCCYEMT
jgi:hypothetical protein